MSNTKRLKIWVIRIRDLFRISYFDIRILALFILINPPSVSLYAATPQSCPEAMEALRAKQLSRLFRMEEDFMKAPWYYRKYQEMVYGSLWQASLMKKDRFSQEKQSEGAIAFERYRYLADQEREKARQTFKRIEATLKNIEEGLQSHGVCSPPGTIDEVGDPISDFHNCMEIFVTETGDRLTALHRLVSRFYKDQEAFSEMVEAHLSDNRSDHDTFTDRFRDYLFSGLVRSTSEFLSLTRELQERFEHKWPGDPCCKACLADKTANQDPVLNQVKLDPQGETGVAGNVVNNARIGDAFDNFEREEQGGTGMKKGFS